MDFAHETTVWFSKSFGLFYLLGLSIAVLIYVYWPSNKKRFDAKSIWMTRTSQVRTMLRSLSVATRTSHGSRRTRSAHRPHDHRP